MIQKINLNNVASYKKSAVLETDKKVNLIYGLNGTGKSTLSNYLYDQTDGRFSECSIEFHLDSDGYEFVVYNQTFIQDNFYESTDLKGIFSLSKENKDAEIKIASAKAEIVKLETESDKKQRELRTEKESVERKSLAAQKAVWKIKTDYSGGDRVLEFCLDKLKSSKEALFNHILGISKTAQKPDQSIDELKKKIHSIDGDNAQKYQKIPFVSFASQYIENEKLFEKQIVGNENSSVSQVIDQFSNSDWVKNGLEYLPEGELTENVKCPFCQEKSISNQLLEQLKNYFDASYESDIDNLNAFLNNYTNSIASIPGKSAYDQLSVFDEYRKDFVIKHDAFMNVVEENQSLMRSKIKTPSVSFTMTDSTQQLRELNEVIKLINSQIAKNNSDIDQKGAVKTQIKILFWQIMRWEYDPVICSYQADLAASKGTQDRLNAEIGALNDKISAQNSVILEQQKKTVNIEESVTSINDGLTHLGMTDFRIKSYSNNLYKIVRDTDNDGIFRSLSEGEKMIISFFYFMELCRGKKESTGVEKKKIIVIDDPISSLSHIYVFNVGRLIKNEFFGTFQKKDQESIWSYKYEQVFILTHSLYFFYEITETNHERRKDSQKLFRLIKNNDGSYFVNMKYEEIQNDYQAYWSIIKDDKQPPALIANSMRNIIEYFFNFVEKKDLNNCFQKPELQENRFQSFCRYINRESHSLGQNISDFKEFNYTDFKEAFSLLFKVSDYEAHYRKMMK